MLTIRKLKWYSLGIGRSMAEQHAAYFVHQRLNLLFYLERYKYILMFEDSEPVS